MSVNYPTADDFAQYERGFAADAEYVRLEVNEVRAAFKALITNKRDGSLNALAILGSAAFGFLYGDVPPGLTIKRAVEDRAREALERGRDSRKRMYARKRKDDPLKLLNVDPTATTLEPCTDSATTAQEPCTDSASDYDVDSASDYDVDSASSEYDKPQVNGIIPLEYDPVADTFIDSTTDTVIDVSSYHESINLQPTAASEAPPFGGGSLASVSDSPASQAAVYGTACSATENETTQNIVSMLLATCKTDPKQASDYLRGRAREDPELADAARAGLLETLKRKARAILDIPASDDDIEAACEAYLHQSEEPDFERYLNKGFKGMTNP